MEFRVEGISILEKSHAGFLTNPYFKKCIQMQYCRWINALGHQQKVDRFVGHQSAQPRPWWILLIRDRPHFRLFIWYLALLKWYEQSHLNFAKYYLWTQYLFQSMIFLCHCHPIIRISHVYIHRITDNCKQWPTPIRECFCNSVVNHYEICARKRVKCEIRKLLPKTLPHKIDDDVHNKFQKSCARRL